MIKGKIGKNNLTIFQVILPKAILAITLFLCLRPKVIADPET